MVDPAPSDPEGPRPDALPLPGQGAMRDAALLERLSMVWLHARMGMLVATAFAMLMAWYLRPYVAATWLLAWLGLKVAITAVRLVQGLAFARSPDPGSAGWRQATCALLAVDGLVWGLGGAWLMAHSVQMASLVAAILACVTCVATFGLQASVRATASYVVPILVPAIGGLLARDDSVGWIGGAGLSMLVFLQLVTAQRSQARLDQGVLLRLRAEQLAAEKEDALQQARRESAVKTLFLANISHELRTPLHGILGLARLLHLEAQRPADAERLELIEGSGAHLLHLINDLMDASRIDAGQFAMHEAPFDLVAQVEQVAGVHAVRAADKGLDFRCDIQAPRPCWVQGDAVRLRQVVHNLLGNAIKFTERGAVTLVLQRDAGSDRVQLQVRDTGPGIAPGEVERAFEAFRQSARGQARTNEGAGLGLTISREIARAMGGDVRIDSQLGQGTTLHFEARLPDAAPPDLRPVDLPPVAMAAAQAVPLATGWSRRPLVLLAEDDDLNAMIASAYLEQLGAQVERVNDGKLAVRHALREQRRPDLVLMDCRMPEMDGFEATREIRCQERALGLGRLPVVALTATVTDEDRRRCLHAGMDDFLSKPFEAEELTAIVQRWTQAQPLMSH